MANTRNDFPGEPEQRESLLANLARFIETRAERPGDFSTSIPGLTFFRREAPAAPVACMVEPSIVLVAQGAKQMWLVGRPTPTILRAS
jgi:hypothetical protein